MFAFKKKYFLIIESIKDLDLRNIKIHNKFNVIYRNFKKSENIDDIKKFRKQCKLKQIKFFIANDTKLAISVKADGLYVSAFNKNLKSLHYKKSNFFQYKIFFHPPELQFCQQVCIQFYLFQKFPDNLEN